MSTSVIDYIFRDLAIHYLGRDDLAHVSQDELIPDVIAAAEETREERRDGRGAPHRVPGCR